MDSLDQENEIFIIYNIINIMFGVSKNELEKCDVGEIYYCFTQINLYINENIHKKFTNIASLVQTEYEGKSVFDEYDRDEGYIEEVEEESIYKLYKEILNYNIKDSIKLLRNSYKESMECNLSELLDFIYFEKKYMIENNDNSEIEEIEEDF